MQAKALISDGKLDEALELLVSQVRDNPADVNLRVYLFQLFAVQGEYQRALNQLSVVGEMDAKTLMMVQTYREIIQCEEFRQQVFAGKRSPLIFGNPEPWVALILEALKLSANGQHDKAQALREQAYQDIPAISGSVNDETFEWIADADSRIGPFVEAMVDGKYFWIPLHRIKTIEFHPPEDLRDLVWLPCEFTWENDGQAVGFVPSRYLPDGEGDPLIRMGRKTEWQEVATDVFHGAGQRLFATEQTDYPMLGIQTITLNHSDSEPTAENQTDMATADQ